MNRVNKLNKKNIEDLLKGLGSQDTLSYDLYLIGGGALAYWGVQESTKDLDIIVNDITSLKNFSKEALVKGFKVFLEPNNSIETNVDKPVSIIRDNLLIDLFHRRTTHFTLTSSMMDRAQSLYHSDNRSISIVSLEDLLLLKSATGRVSDSLVLSNLIQKNINWDIVCQEVHSQLLEKNLRAPYDLLTALKEGELINVAPRKFIKEMSNLVKAQLTY